MAKAFNRLRLEIGALARPLANPALYGLLLGAALLISLAYQRTPLYAIAIGGAPEQDRPYIDDFHDSEATTPGNEQFRFRWTRGESVVRLPGLGARDYQLRLTLTGGPNPARTFRVAVNGNQLHGPHGSAETPFGPGLQEYRFDLPAAFVASGDVVVLLAVAPFTPQGDSRDLGLALNRVEVAPEGGGLTLPAYAELAWLTAAVGLVFAVLARCGFGTRAALAGGALWALGEAGFIAFDRLWLTLLGSTIAWVLLAAGLLIAALDPPLARAWRRFGWAEERAGGRRWLLALFGTVFVLRLCGVLHPHIFIYDIGFHVNRLINVAEEGQYVLKVKSAEWGNRYTYYPPTMYLVLAPLRFLLADKALLIKVFAVTLDSTRILLLYLLVRRATGSARAALLAGFFLAALPISILAYQWGIFSNLFGEWFVLAALCLVVLAYERLRQPAIGAALAAALFMAFVSHPGVILLSGAVFLAIVALFWIARETRGQAGVLAAIYAVALLLSFAAYHRQTVGEMLPQAWQMAQRVVLGAGAGAGTEPTKPTGLSCQRDTSDAALKVQVGGPVFDPSLGLNPRCVHSWPDVLGGGLLGFWAEAVAYFRLLPLAAVPFALLWLRRRQAAGTGRWRAGRRFVPAPLALGAGDAAPARPVLATEMAVLSTLGRVDAAPMPTQAAVGSEPGGGHAAGAEQATALQRRLFWCGIAWLVTAGGFAIVGLVLNLYVRYSLFLAPIAATCAGLFLARVWETGRWGRLAVWAIALSFGLAGLALWYSRITFAGH